MADGQNDDKDEARRYYNLAVKRMDPDEEEGLQYFRAEAEQLMGSNPRKLSP